MDELAQAGLTEEDIFRGKVTGKWRRFMKGQIQRARLFFDEAEKGVTHLDSASRWPVCESLPSYKIQLFSSCFCAYTQFNKFYYRFRIAYVPFVWTIPWFQVLASLWLYRQILDAIEANDYNNFTKRAYVGKAKKLLSLPLAYARAAVAP